MWREGRRGGQSVVEVYNAPFDYAHLTYHIRMKVRGMMTE